MQKLFGTDGIRGQAGKFPLDPKTVKTIGASLARLLAERIGRPPTLITGRDTRESGEAIEGALTAGAAAENAIIESAGVITTPGVAFLTRNFDFDAGVVISASHNPYEDNGIKVFLPSGKKLDTRGEEAIEEDVRDGITPRQAADRASTPDHGRTDQFHKAYVDHLVREVPRLELGGWRIVADCANGAACSFVRPLLEHFGAEVVTINDSPDGRNINSECGSLHLQGLQRAVVEQNAHFGVAFDGDADRALFVDEIGNVVDGDATLWVLARRLQDEGRLTSSTVVATVMSNVGLELALRERGIELIRTAVGDKYVLDELVRSGAAIGGEQSGHIIFPQESLVGDGMLTTLFLLDALAAKGRTLSEAVEGFVKYPQILVNIKVREKRPFEAVPTIAEAARFVEAELDGSGRLLLRYSGTEDLARVMIEGRNQADIERQANSLADVIRAELG
jgi:phosphoglucosamine mutase